MFAILHGSQKYLCYRELHIPAVPGHAFDVT
jgi:hypothetical protein